MPTPECLQRRVREIDPAPLGADRIRLDTRLLEATDCPVPVISMDYRSNDDDRRRAHFGRIEQRADHTTTPRQQYRRKWDRD